MSLHKPLLSELSPGTRSVLLRYLSVYSKALIGLDRMGRARRATVPELTRAEGAFLRRLLRLEGTLPFDTRGRPKKIPKSFTTQPPKESSK